MLDLSIGEIYEPTDLRIIEKAFQDAKAGFTSYGPARGDLEYLEAIRKYYQMEYGLTFEVNQMMATAGATHGMFLALSTLTQPGDEVLVLSPTYNFYRQQIEIVGGNMVEIPTYASNRFLPLEEDLEKSITEKSKFFIFNNPHNPTGRVYPKETVEMIAQLAKNHDLLILCDHVYDMYVFQGTYYPIFALEGMRERTVIVGTFSKNFFMCGWRLGYNIGPSSLIDRCLTQNDAIMFTPTLISQRGGIKALEIYKEQKEKIQDIFKDRMEYAWELFSQLPDIEVSPSQGTFYLWLRFLRGTGLELCEKLEKAGVKAYPGSHFGSYSKDYIRLSITHQKDVLDEVLKRFQEALEI